MNLKLLVAGVATTGLAIGGTGTFVAANVAATDLVVTATVKNHPDNGHGTPSRWALDSFTRTMVVRKTGTNAYTLITTDTGTFTTILNAGSPNGTGAKITRVITGKFSSRDTGHVTGGALLPNAKKLSGKHYDDLHGTPFPAGGAWAKIFFAGTAAVSPFDAYDFRYTTADERWIDASTNNDGQGAAAGNITGKLSVKLTAEAKCRRSKWDATEYWRVTSVRGDHLATFSYRVTYHHKSTKSALATVNPNSSTLISTPYGGLLTVHYNNGYGTLETTHATSDHRILCH